MIDENCIINLPKLTFLPKDPKEAFDYIKESRRPAIDKIIEKMETSPYYQIFDFDLLD